MCLWGGVRAEEERRVYTIVGSGSVQSKRDWGKSLFVNQRVNN